MSGIGNAVLQYLYRLAVACPGLIQHVAESDRVEGPPEVARQLIRVTRVARVGDRACRHGIDIHLHIKAPVIIDAHIILRAREAVDVSSEVSVGHGVAATLNGVKDIPNEGLLHKLCGQSIDRVPVSPWLEGAGVLREANRNRLIARLGIGVQDAIGISMGSKQLRDHRGDIHGAGALF